VKLNENDGKKIKNKMDEQIEWIIRKYVDKEDE